MNRLEQLYRDDPRLRFIGIAMVAIGSIGHALIGLATFELPQQAFAGAQVPAASVGTICAAALIAAIGVIALPRRHSASAAWALAMFWAAAMFANLANAATRSIASWVTASEAAILAISSTAVVMSERPRVRSLPGAAAALMLALFAAVHAANAATISSLIPAFVPVRTILPYATALIMAGAAIAWACGLGRPAFLIVAAMFLSWLPLVHAERIARDAGSPFELEFASMAIALAGALIVAAVLERPRRA